MGFFKRTTSVTNAPILNLLGFLDNPVTDFLIDPATGNDGDGYICTTSGLYTINTGPTTTINLLKDDAVIIRNGAYTKLAFGSRLNTVEQETTTNTTNITNLETDVDGLTVDLNNKIQVISAGDPTPDINVFYLIEASN